MREKVGIFDYGQPIKIRFIPNIVTGRVVALCGPYGPEGSQVYRIRLGRGPKPSYVEVFEEQLEPITKEEFLRLSAPYPWPPKVRNPVKQKVGNFFYGQRVKMLHAPNLVIGRVVEWCGPLGPNGAQVYRIRLGRKTDRSYVDVLEEQLEAIPDEAPVPDQPKTVEISPVVSATQ